ncbi:MAG TPA: hypothetical protein VFB79_01995, partial [Candidatus Angelobacter sp.]|nr:hypothetical protein [Candidatus Angelobacter sp.]
MEQIIPKLPVEALQQIAGYLNWDPFITYQAKNGNVDPGRLLSQMTEIEQHTWLDTHRVEIMKKISAVGGHSLINLFRGAGIQYREIVANVGSKLGLDYDTTAPIEQLEGKILSKIWNNLVATLTPEQRRELEAKAEQEANKFGRTFKGELTGFGALGAAQLSGFGIYILGSTLLGTINGVLGLG